MGPGFTVQTRTLGVSQPTVQRTREVVGPTKTLSIIAVGVVVVSPFYVCEVTYPLPRRRPVGSYKTSKNLRCNESGASWYSFTGVCVIIYFFPQCRVCEVTVAVTSFSYPFSDRHLRFYDCVSDGRLLYHPLKTK